MEKAGRRDEKKGEKFVKEQKRKLLSSYVLVDLAVEHFTVGRREQKNKLGLCCELFTLSKNESGSLFAFCTEIAFPFWRVCMLVC